MIHLSNPGGSVDQETIVAVVNTLESGRYILGENTKKLEENFAEFIGTKHAVAVSSGTAAIHLALLALNIKPGSEVITVSHSFIATANPVIHIGATPIFTDIDIETYTMDPEKIEDKITKKTSAIIPVHLYGHACDMDPINEIADEHGLRVVEDACQAHGAEYKGRKAGVIGDVGCFSFFPSKVMTVCGDGGIVVTDDYAVAEKVKMLRNQGRKPEKKYHHDIVGFNYRMSEVSAAIGLIQLANLPAWIKTRRTCAKHYSRLLSGVGDIVIPAEKEWARAVYYVYTIRTKKRDELREWLSNNDIETGIYYPCPIHLQPAYSTFGLSKGALPVTEQVVDEIISLPMHQYLSQDDIEFIASSIKKFFQ